MNTAEYSSSEDAPNKGVFKEYLELLNTNLFFEPERLLLEGLQEQIHVMQQSPVEHIVIDQLLEVSAANRSDIEYDVIGVRTVDLFNLISDFLNGSIPVDRSVERPLMDKVQGFFYMTPHFLADAFLEENSRFVAFGSKNSKTLQQTIVENHTLYDKIPFGVFFDRSIAPHLHGDLFSVVFLDEFYLHGGRVWQYEKALEKLRSVFNGAVARYRGNRQLALEKSSQIQAIRDQFKQIIQPELVDSAVEALCFVATTRKGVTVGFNRGIFEQARKIETGDRDNKVEVEGVNDIFELALKLDQVNLRTESMPISFFEGNTEFDKELLQYIVSCP